MFFENLLLVEHCATLVGIPMPCLFQQELCVTYTIAEKSRRAALRVDAQRKSSISVTVERLD